MRGDVSRFPRLRATERAFNGSVWTTPPNPLKVWSAEIAGQRGGNFVRISATGITEEEALTALDEAVGALVGLGQNHEPKTEG